jgi:hypothetical protein
MKTMPQLHPNIPAGRFELVELLAYEPPCRWRPEVGEKIIGQLVKQVDRRSFGREAPTLFVLVPPGTGDEHDDRYVVVRASGVVLRGALDQLKPQPWEWVAFKYEGLRPTADGTREYAYYRMGVKRDGRWVVAK